MRASTRAVTAALLITAAGLPSTVHAGGGDGGAAPTLSAPHLEGLAGPLQLTVHGEALYVSQSFAGVLTKATLAGSVDIAANPGGEIAGSAVDGKSVVYATRTDLPDGSGTVATSTITRLRKGETTVIADLLAYETENNPDQDVQYGFVEPLPEGCVVPPQIPVSYTGIVDTHAYALADAGHDRWYVADAGGNDILSVTGKGKVRTVAVLPPQPLVVTAEAAAAAGLPDCTIGLTYNFESVPTDVEVGKWGILYVTTLPGGPEDPALGARGAVYAVNPWNGDVWQVASGLASPTNLALDHRGRIYVAELFGNRVSKIVDGLPQTVVEVAQPAGLEYAFGQLIVSYDVFGPSGKVSTIDI